VFRLDHDHHPQRLEAFKKCIGNVSGQTFLKLKAAGKRFSQSREFGDSEYATLLRNVRYVTLADKWRQVMFTHRRDTDVFYNDHLIVFVAG
jgi:hypothetical protein